MGYPQLCIVPNLMKKTRLSHGSQFSDLKKGRVYYVGTEQEQFWF